MRVELIHPMIVAFPIAILLLGAALRLAAFFLKKHEFQKSFVWFSRLIVGIGLGFAILAMITGQIAHNHVHDMLCDHDVLDNHQFLAFTATLLFALGLILDVLRNKNRALGALGTLFYWLAPIFLILTGAYGGKLVFEQGAAVEKVCTGNTNPEHHHEH